MGKATRILSLFSELIPQALVNKTYPLTKVSVFYHLVNPKPVPFAYNLYRSITPEQFEKDLDYLLFNFKDKLELSFDDGLSDCAEVIAPVLKRKGIQALFFLNTAFIDNQDLFYRYKAALIADACFKNPLLQQKIQQQLTSPVIPYLYQISYKNKAELDELAVLAEIDFKQYLAQQKPYLSSIQIESLLADGFVIGAHSIDHPPFFELSAAEQIHQVKTSVEALTKRFNLTYQYFSFPFTDWGLSKQFFQEIYQARLVDATWGCAGLKHDEQPNHTQRIALDANYHNATQAIKTEWLYYQLKQVFHKNSIQRI